MDIVEAASKLIPGTAWILYGDGIDSANDRLVQADDGTPRVIPPTQKEIQIYIDSNTKIPVHTDTQLSAIWDFLDLKQAELPVSTKDVLDKVKAAR